MRFKLRTLFAIVCLAAVGIAIANFYWPREHPREVLRLIRLIPQIPHNADLTRTCRVLGIPSSPDSTEIFQPHIAYWQIDEKYRLAISFKDESHNEYECAGLQWIVDRDYIYKTPYRTFYSYPDLVGIMELPPPKQ